MNQISRNKYNLSRAMTTPGHKLNIIYGFLIKQTNVSDSASSESVSHYSKLTGTDVHTQVCNIKHCVVNLHVVCCVLTKSLCVFLNIDYSSLCSPRNFVNFVCFSFHGIIVNPATCCFNFSLMRGISNRCVVVWLYCMSAWENKLSKKEAAT